MKTFYLPATCDILTVGHIKIMKRCKKRGRLIVGLLTNRALKNYKITIMSFGERRKIVEAIKYVDLVMPQDSLNCYDNLIKCKADYLVSGDGFETLELEAAKKAKCKTLEIRFPGEIYQKKYSSSAIKQKICNLVIQ